jgi:hypothetical protein
MSQPDRVCRRTQGEPYARFGRDPQLNENTNMRRPSQRRCDDVHVLAGSKDRTCDRNLLEIREQVQELRRQRN